MRTKTRAKRRFAIAIAMVLALQCTVFSTSVFAAEDPALEQPANAAVTETVEATTAETEATEQAAPGQPEKPEAESYLDNEKIEEYNQKVDAYNEAAEKHNAAVDEEYEAAVKETEAMNAEIDQHNAAELERVKAAEESNEKALKAAEEENARIAEENEAEEARVIAHNESEDAKVKASEEAKAAAEKENEEITKHNEAVDKYEADKVQYDADYAQYEKDKAMEDKIKAAGYASVEQYNDRINKAYNEPAKKSVEMNAKTEINSVSDTYKVTEATEKAGRNVQVSVKHIFEGTDVSYQDDFTIDANDTITLNSIAALGSATKPGYASFYYKTDEAHSMGYWCESWSQLETTARHCEYGWNCGDEHVISYSEGKSHPFDEEVIDMTYYYFWNPLKVYKTYNTPVAPEELTNPGERKALVEVPELYTANYEQFVKKDFVTAQLEDIPAADIREHIAAPVKAAYIEMLSHMDLFEVPAVEEPAKNEESPIAPAEEDNTPAAPADKEDTTPAAPAEEDNTPAAPADKDDAPMISGIADEGNTPAAPAAPATGSHNAPAASSATAPAAISSTQQTANNAPAASNTVITENAAPAASTAKAEKANTVEIVENAAPAAAPASIEIEDTEAPQAEGTGYWALLNLLFTIGAALMSLLMMALYFTRRNREKDDEEESEIKKHGLARVLSIVPAVAAIVIFILTENMANPMRIADDWTLLMAVLFAANLVLAIASRKTSEDKEAEQEAAPAMY